MGTGANVSKGLAYGVLAPPKGVSIAKSSAYAVLAPPKGTSVIKAVAYAVLSTENKLNITKALAYAVVRLDDTYITALTPSTIHVSGGSVVVTGAGFEPSSVLMLDGVVTPVTFVSSTQLSFVAPAHAAGTVSVTVKNTIGFVSSPATLTYAAASIISVTPGSAGPGAAVSVNGVGFFPGAQVRIGGVSVPSTYISSTQLNTVVPQLPAGTYDVEVDNASTGYSETLVKANALIITAPVTAVSSNPIIMYIV